MRKWDLINELIRVSHYKSYLEIGVDHNENFDQIKCQTKVGVDPDPKGEVTYRMKSDKFFEEFRGNFDIIFIDGLHHEEQVMRDIISSLFILNKKGTIVCHDMNPIEEEYQLVPKQSGFWNGDCWKAWVKLRRSRNDLEMFVIDIETGCGIIRHGEQELLSSVEELTWRNLCKNRKKWLNLVDANGRKLLEIKRIKHL